MSDLLFAAFKALGMGANHREITLVANALRASGDAEVRELLGSWPPNDHREAWDRLKSIVEEAGAGGLVALDLATAFQNPDAFAHLMGPRDGEAERPRNDMRRQHPGQGQECRSAYVRRNPGGFEPG